MTLSWLIKELCAWHVRHRASLRWVNKIGHLGASLKVRKVIKNNINMEFGSVQVHLMTGILSLRIRILILGITWYHQKLNLRFYEKACTILRIKMLSFTTWKSQRKLAETFSQVAQIAISSDCIVKLLQFHWVLCTLPSSYSKGSHLLKFIAVKLK